MSEENKSKKSPPSHGIGEPSTSGSRDSASALGAASSGAASSDASRDVVLIHGVTEDKKGLRVLRARPEGIELGEVRPVQEGQPLNHDLVRLKPREGAPYICDVHTEFSMNDVPGRSLQAPASSNSAARNSAARNSAAHNSAAHNSAAHNSAAQAKAPPEKQAKGPAQVATQTYRDGWDAIWASGRKSGDLN